MLVARTYSDGLMRPEFTISSHTCQPVERPDSARQEPRHRITDNLRRPPLSITACVQCLRVQPGTRPMVEREERRDIILSGERQSLNQRETAA